MGKSRGVPGEIQSNANKQNICAFLTEYSNAKTNKWYEKHFTTKDETVTNEDVDETI